MLVTRAAALAQSYPAPQTLILVLKANWPQLPDGFSESVEGARAPFD